MIKIIGIIVPIIIALFGWIYFDRKKARHNRIEKVTGGYIRLTTSHPRQDSGISALMKAGACELKNDKEIREVLDRIKGRGLKHPFGKHENQTQNVDLKQLLGNFGAAGQGASLEDEINKLKESKA